jgi:hypothetical protein
MWRNCVAGGGEKAAMAKKISEAAVMWHQRRKLGNGVAVNGMAAATHVAKNL